MPNSPAIFDDLPDLETPRLLLRKVRLADAADILDYASDPAVAQYTSWDHYSSLADAYRFIHWALDRYQRKSEAPWGIVLKDEDKLIGTIGFTDHAPLHRRAEVNYALSAKYWRQGLTPEALHRILDHGFNTLRLNRIESRCIPDNVASARVMEKVGMKYEGLLRGALHAKGTFHDLQIYAALREEWKP